MPDTTVRVEYIGAVQNFSEVTITGNQQVWRIGSSAFVETGRASQLVASGKFRYLANDPAMLPANQAKVGATPSVSGVAGEGRGVVKLGAGSPVWLKPSDPIVHDLPLTHSLLARVGADLTFARTGASAVVDCYGSLQFCRSGEARFWGARRVENKIVDDTFTSSVTLAANTTKALRTDVLGPYRNRRNVYELTRTSGTGAIFTLNSASYRAGQHTYSIWLGGDGTTQ